MGQTPCVNGFSGIYPCNNVDMLSFVGITDMGVVSGTESTDIWGWTDKLTGKEYAILGLTNGTSFVDISDPINPIYLGRLPTQTFNSPWRDVKVIKDHAYIVSEATNHGVQSFDLRTLRNLTNIPTTFTALSTFNGIGSGGAHNVVALEESEHIVVVGALACSGGLFFIDVSDPANMVSAGCFSADGYTHDAVCFVYKGPDSEHCGKEICVASNEDTQTIVDVTDKSSPIQLSRFEYPTFSYTHQSWITDDQKYALLDDEFDETTFGQNTRTHIIDISNLDSPTYIDYYQASTAARDHNQYVRGQYSYQANYRAGFRMVDLRDVSNGNLTEEAFFDTYPANDNSPFNAAWSVYPYFQSGNLIVSDIEQGLFVLKANVPHFVIETERFPIMAAAGDDVEFKVDLSALNGYTDMVKLKAIGSAPGVTYTFEDSALAADGSTTLTIGNTDGLSGAYNAVIQGRGPSNNSVHDIAISFKILSRYFVDASVTSSGNGLAWNSAFNTLEEALAAADEGAEIWVRAGTYKPTTTTDRSLSFMLEDGHQIYGGFDGSETERSQRDIVNNETILSGDIGTEGLNADNSYHVLRNSGLTSTCLIDGFTIKDGNANNPGNTNGGGLLNENRLTVMRNCTLVDNLAALGSAIYNSGSEIILEDCEIIGQDANLIYNDESNLEVKRVVKLIKN